MAESSLLTAGQGASAGLGQYFSVVSLVPSVILVSYVKLLAASGAWDGHPDWSAAARQFTELGIGGVAQLVLASLLVGLALHPLQYALVQFCEGYWGVGRTGQWLMLRGIRRHRDRYKQLSGLRSELLDKLIPDDGIGNARGMGRVSDDNLPLLALYQETIRLQEYYPARLNDVRPTRLGNVLRRYEANFGTPYELNVSLVPHLAAVAEKTELTYLDEQRTDLDLAVRLAVVSAMSTVASVLFLWRGGLWLLISLVPYALAYGFYRGAVTVAAEYGVAFTVLLDLNRFALYERLHLKLPDDAGQEREQNRLLNVQVIGRRVGKSNLSYVHPHNAQAATDESAEK
jgi:hypothetical protein